MLLVRKDGRYEGIALEMIIWSCSGRRCGQTMCSLTPVTFFVKSRRAQSIKTYTSYSHACIFTSSSCFSKIDAIIIDDEALRLVQLNLYFCFELGSFPIECWDTNIMCLELLRSKTIKF